MRESSGYCVPSEEYRQKYELEAQQNMELREKAVLHDNIITTLKTELRAARLELSNKSIIVDNLQTQLQQQKEKTSEWMEKFELQDLKTERAHQRRMEVEDKMIHTEKVASMLRAEMEKMNSVQVLLGGEIRSIKQKVEDQRLVIEHSEDVNRQLVAKVDNLTSLCRDANKKIDADALVIQAHKSVIDEQKKELSECNDFITFVREREETLVARLGHLEEYYQAKRQQRCMLFRKDNRRQVHPAEAIVLGIKKLLVKEKLQAPLLVTASRQPM